jgi:hypothetical protein
MNKSIITTVFFFILTAITSFAQVGVWIEETVDPNTGLRTGKIQVNGVLYEIRPNVSITRARLWTADLTRANLRGAYLEEASLGGAYLEGADLSHANLRGADLEGARLKDANLRGANLAGANLAGANLAGANLAGANLDEISRDTIDLNNLIEINTLKTQIAEGGITDEQAAAIEANTAKVGITQAQADAITANTAQVGGAVEQIAIVENRYRGITNDQGVAIAANTVRGVEQANQIAILQATVAAMNAQLQQLAAQIPQLQAAITEKDAQIAELSKRPTLQEVQDARLGSAVILKDWESDEVTLNFNLEKSDDLKTWIPFEGGTWTAVANGGVKLTLPLNEAKKLLRVTLKG